MITHRIMSPNWAACSQIWLQVRRIINLIHHNLLILQLSGHGIDLGSEFKFRLTSSLSWGAYPIDLGLEEAFQTINPQLIRINEGMISLFPGFRNPAYGGLLYDKTNSKMGNWYTWPAAKIHPSQYKPRYDQQGDFANPPQWLGQL